MFYLFCLQYHAKQTGIEYVNYVIIRPNYVTLAETNRINFASKKQIYTLN